MTKICPKCRSNRVIPIVQGYPSADTWKAAQRGELKLGGCTIIAHDPEWYCKDCKNEFDVDEKV